MGLGGAPITPVTSLPQAWPTQAHNAQVNSYFQSQPRPIPLPQQSQVPDQRSQNALEEGELSEGEFEDLYEPKVATDVAQSSLHNKSTQPLNNMDSRNGSVGDADESSIYDPHDPHVGYEENLQLTSKKNTNVEPEYLPHDEWEPSYPDRERSGSYSPCLSPREVQRKASIAKAMSRDAKVTNGVGPSQSTNPTDTPIPSLFSTAPETMHTIPALSGTNNKAAPTLSDGHEHLANGKQPSSFRSPLEAKKKAQEAILGLWPLKVRYQDYIEEGVKPEVVRALFKDIGLDVPVPKTSTAPGKTSSSAQPTSPAVVTTSTPPSKAQSSPTDKSRALPTNTKQDNTKDTKGKSSDMKATEKSAAEERKDKIARKLAAMAQKTTTTQNTGQGASAPAPATVLAPTPTAAPTTSIPISAPPSTSLPFSAPAPSEVGPSVGTKVDATKIPSAVAKTRAENNAKLQQKLAALKKQQAQLAADKARAVSNDSTTTSSPASGDPSSLDASRNGNSTPKPRSALSAHQPLNRESSSELKGDPRNEGIPGLSLSSPAFSQPAQGSFRSLKRPVASDFDSYTPRSESQKRTRTEERLVIDVSDDEDVEMEIGSPIDEGGDEVPPSTDSSVTPARQTLGTFPPLSEGPNRRQQESPVSSSAPTPPVHGARIDLLHKRIEETKRRIAEAEAKKAAKKATTQPSPKPSSPIVQQTNDVPASNHDNAKDTLNSRRDRIASYELPRVVATLKEKQDKLKLLVAEAARLELEVQAGLDEQQKLTTEMGRLSEPLSEHPSGPDDERNTTSRNGESSGLEIPPSARSTQPGMISPRPSHTTASGSQQGAAGEGLGESQSSHGQESLPTNVGGETDIERNHDDALQAAILTDNNSVMDLEMEDTGAFGAATDSEPVTGLLPTNTLSESRETSAPTQPAIVGIRAETQGTPNGLSTNEVADASLVAEEALSATSVPPSESDAGSSDSDISMQQSVPELSQSDDESPYEPALAEISDPQGRQNDEPHNSEIADDVLEEANPNHASASQDRPESRTGAEENEDAQSNTPVTEDLLSYKSPLSYFRAYRFHPKYFDEVPGGLKSLTFSAKIDPKREVCPWALSGEPCPEGPNCEYQHFDSMVLQEAEIITQLGSSDMFVGETRTKFIEGLKRVLGDLRANRVKDFDRITRAIVKHRQEFLGDKIKVLALDSGSAT